jgi:quinolinate synthase
MGHPLESMVVWDPSQPGGGLTGEQVRRAVFILWNGHCSVHQIFLPGDVDRVRAEHPSIRVIVHPECPWEVVQKADLFGSTERISQVIEAAEAGSSWAVGTEVHLVKRLADRFMGVKHVQSLSDCQCLCTTMYRIDPRHLLWSLDNLAAGRVVNRIRVDDESRTWARVALGRMLALPGG